jgi:uncharacterized membrane protein
MSDETKSNSFDFAVMAIMTALVIVTTSFTVPFTPTGGYFNLGDIIVVTTALLFGPVIGGFTGGVGSALADVWLGYAAFAPITLVVKGVEGYVVGYIAGPQKDPSRNRIIISWVIGGLIIVAGYWIAEVFIMGYGAAAATAEALTINSLQAIVSGVGIPLSSAIKKRLNI